MQLATGGTGRTKPASELQGHRRSRKNEMLGEQPKQLKPPQHKVYELSNKHWRARTSARHCIEVTIGQCVPCDLLSKTCILRSEKPIVFSEHQIR